MRRRKRPCELQWFRHQEPQDIKLLYFKTLRPARRPRNVGTERIKREKVLENQKVVCKDATESVIQKVLKAQTICCRGDIVSFGQN